MTGAIVVSGTTSGLAIVRSLGSRGVPLVVADWSEHDYAGVSRYAHHDARLPDPQQDESGFVAALLDQARLLPGALLIPASDAALVYVSRNREQLQGTFVVASPGWDVVGRVIDKRRTYEIARSVGVAIPRTSQVTSVAEVGRFGDMVGYPCLVKPSQSHLFQGRFRCKMFPAADARQLVRMYSKAVDAGLEVVLQEFVPGGENDGVNYNSYRWDGHQLVEFTALKIRNAPPRYGSPRVVVSQRIPGLSGPAQRLLDALELEGFSCVEFKRDQRDGTFKLMEVNARHNMSGSLAIRCGIDFPWMQYRHLLHGEQPVQPDQTVGIYWIDLLTDVKQTLRNLRQEGLSLKEYARPYTRPHVFAVASAHDPRPFLKRLQNQVPKLPVPSHGQADKQS
jgi:predicted ATP-grasp superfamily ATP-dependent carboligase